MIDLGFLGDSVVGKEAVLSLMRRRKDQIRCWSTGFRGRMLNTTFTMRVKTSDTGMLFMTLSKCAVLRFARLLLLFGVAAVTFVLAGKLTKR